MRRAGTLVLAPDRAIWIREDASFFTSSNGMVPYTSVRGKRFTFTATTTGTGPG
jgi:hypothetical protein